MRALARSAAAVRLAGRAAKRVVRRFALPAAWVAALGLGALLVFERSGLLARAIERRLAEELGAVGETLRIESASLSWFEPGVEIGGLALDAGGGSLRVGRAHVALDVFGDAAVDWIVIEDVDLVATPGLFTALRETRARGGSARERDADLALFPRVAVRDLRLAVPARPGTDAPPSALGTLDLELAGGPVGPSLAALDADERRARLARAEGPLLAGRFTPAAADGAGRSSTVSFRGVLAAADALHVRASALELGLAELEPAARALLGPLPIRSADGVLAFQADAVLDPTGASPPRGTLDAELRDGRIVPPRAQDESGVLSALAVRLRAVLAPARGQSLSDPGAWSALAHARADLRGSSVDAWVAAGREAGPDLLVRGWARLPDFSLERESLETIGLWRLVEEEHQALEPRGRAAATIGLRVPRGPEGGVGARDLVLALDHDGRTGMTFHGWVDRGHPERGREGLPLPIEGLRGRIVYADHRAQGRPERVGLFALEGDHGGGPLRVSGMLISPDGGSRRPEIDLVIEADDRAVDDALRAALGGIEGAAMVSTFQPKGGALDARVRAVQHARYGGFVMGIDLRLRDVGLTWAELPVPLAACTGDLRLRWAAREHVERDEAGEPRPGRAFGVAFALDGGVATAEGVTVRGVFRDELRPPTDPAAPLPPANEVVQAIDVDLRSLSLKGADRNVMTQRWSEVGRQVDAMAPKGRIDVRYLGTRPRPGEPFAYELVATPTEVEIQPSAFRMRTRDVRGHVLLRSVEVPAGEPGEGDEEELLTLVADRAGPWVGDVPIAATARVEPGQVGRLLVFGAGIDPANTSFRGAFATALAESDGTGAAPDLSALGVEGRVDFRAELDLAAVAAEPAADLARPAATPRLRVHLRENALFVEDFRLEALDGILTLEDGVLQSERLDARLARTPLSLSDARLLEASAIGRLGATPSIVERARLGPSSDGVLFLARLHANDLPIDAEHLGAFVERDALDEALERFGWGGTLDFDGTEVLLWNDGRGGGRLALEGLVGPHNMTLDAGLPLHVTSAELDVRSLVFERGRARAWVELEGLFGRLAERSLENASMTVTYVDGRLTLGALEGELEGGTITSAGSGGRGTALAVELVEPYRFDLALRLGGEGAGRADAELERLLHGLFDSSVLDLGKVRAELMLTGSPDRLLDLIGRGSIEVRGARLWSIPVARELFTRLGFDRSAQFDRMSTLFEVRDGEIEFTAMRVHSPLLELVGGGTLKLDGELHFHFDVRYSLVDKLGPLNRLVYWIQNSLLRVEVRGDMARPEVFLRNGLSELISAHAKWERQLPVPGFSAPPARF